jgi:hypothetical protein
MHSCRQCQERQARQIRGALHEAVRGPIPGCQSCSAEGVGEIEAIKSQVFGELHVLEVISVAMRGID